MSILCWRCHYSTAENYSIIQFDSNQLKMWMFQRAVMYKLERGGGGCRRNYDHKTFYVRKILEKVDSHTNLGVYLQFNSKLDRHINRITGTATQRLAQLRRILKHADTPTREIARQ